MAKSKNGWKKLPKIMQFCEMKYPEVMNRFAIKETETLKENIVKRTPVDTGRLRAGFHSVQPEYDGKKWVLAISNNVEYAEFVEYGHRWVRRGFKSIKLEDYNPETDKTGFTKGRFMARDGLKETKDGMQSRYRSHIEAFFKMLEGVLK